jgi:ELWxxDGT repeat protein
VQIWSYSTGSPPFIPVGDRFVAFAESAEFGTEPHSYDPITGEVELLADTTPGVRGHAVDYLTIARGVIFFSSLDPVLGSMLWRTDGTPSGTIPIGTPSAPANVSGYKALMIGQHLYLGAADAEHGHEVWVVDFCGADYNYDRAVTIDDLLAFLKDFEGQSVEADLSGAGVSGDFPDGATTIDDLLYFLVHFEVGC